MFIGADEFFENIMMWRKVWIGGALRSGKTCTAVAIGHELIERGILDNAWTNFPCKLPPAKRLYRTAIILDETSQFVDSRNTRGIHTQYGTMAGKDQCVWICPSVDPPDIRLRDVSVMRAGSLAMGADVWFFQYLTKATDILGVLQKPKAFTLLPKKYFGLYDTFWKPRDDGGIEDWITAEQKRLGIRIRGKTRLEES
jgi:hypothetical protein